MESLVNYSELVIPNATFFLNKHRKWKLKWCFRKHFECIKHTGIKVQCTTVQFQLRFRFNSTASAKQQHAAKSFHQYQCVLFKYQHHPGFSILYMSLWSPRITIYIYVNTCLYLLTYSHYSYLQHYQARV